MYTLVMIAADLVAITILALGIYYLRHRRRDLVVAFVGVNVGVLAVAVVLAGTSVALGLGLGLFGVLSIIRLRSSEISQREVAYYFASLALGLIAGLSSTLSPVSLGLMALIIVAMFIADHPRLLSRSRQLTMTLDRAIGDESELVAQLERVLGGTVTQVSILQLDFVNDTTQVDVRYRIGAPAEVSSALAGARR
ncbi:DUF4956 domain-containing protein [Microbacterium saperdae]|uniref:Uncharacterized protein DUF4956 n=1 Tax=Microbacterium saperdae TaxID=69368 RepID=A0A543BN17_9MICO|nr:DUF4956 domain-containing protein [Microbacterium saperdae]TQL86168.1 uncharacterized protein DUF4956 [Microbacterium saperdae]GGM50128.1 DUF4956 domain-containing protein [Microbacterium saperdae]